MRSDLQSNTSQPVIKQKSSSRDKRTRRHTGGLVCCNHRRPHKTKIQFARQKSSSRVSPTGTDPVGACSLRHESGDPKAGWTSRGLPRMERRKLTRFLCQPWRYFGPVFTCFTTCYPVLHPGSSSRLQHTHTPRPLSFPNGDEPTVHMGHMGHTGQSDLGHLPTQSRVDKDTLELLHARLPTQLLRHSAPFFCMIPLSRISPSI